MTNGTDPTGVRGEWPEAAPDATDGAAPEGVVPDDNGATEVGASPSGAWGIRRWQVAQPPGAPWRAKLTVSPGIQPAGMRSAPTTTRSLPTSHVPSVPSGDPPAGSDPMTSELLDLPLFTDDPPPPHPATTPPPTAWRSVPTTEVLRSILPPMEAPPVPAPTEPTMASAIRAAMLGTAALSPAAAPPPVAAPEPTAMPESVAAPEPTAMPESVAAPEPTAMPEPVAPLAPAYPLGVTTTVADMRSRLPASAPVGEASVLVVGSRSVAAPIAEASAPTAAPAAAPLVISAPAVATQAPAATVTIGPWPEETEAEVESEVAPTVAPKTSLRRRVLWVALTVIGAAILTALIYEALLILAGRSPGLSLLGGLIVLPYLIGAKNGPRAPRPELTERTTTAIPRNRSR